ncbi:hypothetical protein BN1708_002138 [Verticillium longisporum]|uniref:DUF676 domain-containing protein n=1 Tax=Verticillium longisporum TaxID=100787 RepID=A0A0G4KH92_VERLO|nr:hypothetical protein BN1708_002138 [Verticillium longisporum]
MSQPALGLQVVRPTSDGSPLVIKKEDEVNVDIVFVHGLNGGSHATWTKNGFFWPRELMHQLPGARIMTYGFNTGFKRQGLFAKDHIRAFDIAGDLIDQLCHLRRGQDTRPLIMVAHSLGGLIVKQALVEARRSSQASIRTVFDAVISVIFFGTPHTIGALMGVQYRDTVKGIAKFGGYTVPHEIQRNLSLHSKELFNIRRAFNRLLVLDAKKILVVNFHETKARYGRLIVDGLTASLGESSRPIGDDHEGMVKFEDHDSPAFKMTVQDIWRALQNWTESKTFWIDASSAWTAKAGLTRLYVELSTDMCIQRGMPPSHPAALAERAPENLIESFNEWKKPFLIVYDNFRGVYSDDFASLMPTQGSCAILFTSRDTPRLEPNARTDILLVGSDARSIGNDTILIDHLIRTDALDLLLQVSGHSEVALSESEMSAAEQLLLQLERIPRVIESVGKCIGQLQQPAPFSAYLNAYMNRGKAIHFSTDTSTSRMPDTSISDRSIAKIYPRSLLEFDLLDDNDTEFDTETSSIVRAGVFSGPESCSESYERRRQVFFDAVVLQNYRGKLQKHIGTKRISSSQEFGY